MGIARERLTPAQTLTLMALPMDEREFVRQCGDRGRHEYAAGYGTWPRYWHSIGRFLCEKAAQLERLGAMVRTDGTLDALARATRTPSVRAVSLMAHWTGSAIEFADGFHTPAQVAAEIAPAFDGIVHLCVCSSLEAARHLDRANDRVLVHFCQDPVEPDVWMVYLLVVAKMLQSGRATYLEALTAARKALLDHP